MSQNLNNLDRDQHIPGGNILGGTFGRSNAPKLASNRGKSQSTLFQKVEMQNTHNNLDSSLNFTAKSLSNAQFKNIKKNLNKLQDINIKNGKWSKLDFDSKHVTQGIGGQ